MPEIHIPIEMENYEKKIYDLQQLIEISKGLNSTLDFNLLIEAVLLTIMGQMHVYKTGIFLYKDMEDPHLYLHSNYKGFDLTAPLESYYLHEDEALVAYFFEENRCLLRQDIVTQSEFSSWHSMTSVFGIELVVPLRAKGRVVGIIILGEKLSHDLFTEEEKEFLLTLAAIAAIAVENARLYELATVDMMTRLRIHHFFQTRLKEERERAKRQHLPLALLLTDIDHFKKVNDTYGHQTGDLILKEVARLLAHTVRNVDIAARYGGEEFAAILPDTGLPEALLVAERIRYSVEQHIFVTPQGEVRVTLCVGVAIYQPDHDKTNKEFIERADQALYRAKKNGRNLVEA